MRPEDKPLENDAEVEIIDVSEYEPNRYRQRHGGMVNWRGSVESATGGINTPLKTR